MSNFCLLLVIYYGFWPKMGQNPYHSIVSATTLRRHCDVAFDCIVMNFFYKLTLILSYFIPKFVKIEGHFHGQKNRPIVAQWGWGGGGWCLTLAPTPSLCLILEPRR